ncbi:MAG: response regulator [Candidatus Competibacteraceae bacterium]|nr:response regulator [Candidatus Competibacteraceae bacterium]MCB1769510.1 response regulator [Candidatus Competibacteraceae bacterium]MCB1820878.1 response regulator [Candidatus Competibacteraceae bacterium]MCP5126738.1 response regulator [Gammaproteobacteria bacterium]HRX72094.1 response regulator [Candidatus Competibacteraceae bacterium]
MPAKEILIVEDEPKIAQLLSDYLQAASFQTRWLDHGDRVIDSIQHATPDLLLLDLMLPGKDGLTICQELRRFSDLPVIMVTARVEEIDRLLGLELGADDYICKPFSPREVVARVKVIFRRLDCLINQASPKTGFTVDEERMQIRCAGQPLDLTPNEYRLLAILLKRPGRVYSRDALLDQLYDTDHDVSDRSIDSHIKNLRKKLAAIKPDQTLIHSIYGVGYKLEVE